jgi:hypothetical protein
MIRIIGMPIENIFQNGLSIDLLILVDRPELILYRVIL